MLRQSIDEYRLRDADRECAVKISWLIILTFLCGSDVPSHLREEGHYGFHIVSPA
jgi:hypothetical protein